MWQKVLEVFLRLGSWSFKKWEQRVFVLEERCLALSQEPGPN